MARQDPLQWDIESLKATVQDLERERDDLQGYWNYIDGLRRNAAQSWQSPAGTDYQSRMAAELASLNNLLRQLQKHIDAMKDVIGKCYEKCELELRGSVRTLRNQIK